MSPVSVVALVAAYNEADVVGAVVRDLIAQGVSVYFLDDGSTDGTVDAVAPLLGNGVVQIERLGAAGSSPERFEWERILRRKEQLAAEFDADWFIHHDADEFRESPWRGVSLADGIALVDRLGYNAVDALSLDFWPTHDRFEPGTDVRDAFTHYVPAAVHDRRQIRCWKKTGAPVDLASSGGHEAQFEGRRVFPIRFLQRHYPIRGQAHGERKVRLERVPRFSPSERERGWHVQYEDTGTSFMRDPATLIPFDADSVRVQLALEHRGVEDLKKQLWDANEALDAARNRAFELEAALAREAEAHRKVRHAHDSELAAHQLDRAEWTDARAALENRLGDATAQLQAVQGDLHACTDDLRGHRTALSDATRRVTELQRSWSWRLSAPARAIFRLLAGRSS